MLVRRILLSLCLFFLVYTLGAKDNSHKLYIEIVTYEQANEQEIMAITQEIRKRYMEQGIFSITDDENAAHYILTCMINEENEDLVLSMEIMSTSVDKASEIVVKKTHRDNGISNILQETIDYIHRKLFPFEIYCSTNESFFTTKKIKDMYEYDVIARNENTNKDNDFVKKPKSEIEDSSETENSSGNEDPAEKITFFEIKNLHFHSHARVLFNLNCSLNEQNINYSVSDITLPLIDMMVQYVSAVNIIKMGFGIRTSYCLFGVFPDVFFGIDSGRLSVILDIGGPVICSLKGTESFLFYDTCLYIKLHCCPVFLYEKNYKSH